MDPATNGTSKASSVLTSLFGRGGGSKHKYSPLGHGGEESRAGGGISESQTQLLPGESIADESLDEESQLPQGRQKRRGLLYRLVWGDPNKIFVKLIMLLLMIPLFSYLTAASLRVLSPQPVPCDSPELGYQCNQKTTHTWGQYSPFFSVPSEISPSVPDGCRLTSAQVLSRHGARFPTPGKAAAISAVLTKIKTSATWYAPDFEFIKTYDYVLGVDHLTAFGEQEMVNSGIKFYQRYASLIQDNYTEDPESLPFIRASGQERVIASAENFTTGFYSALLADKNPSSLPDPPKMVIISESPTANNTMHHGLCRAFEDSTTGDLAQAEFIAATFPPITARLNARGFKGVTLSNTDVLSLMDLCPFDTVAYPLSSLTATSSLPWGGKLSPFCSLFIPSDWTIYDYLQSLGKYYGYGPGNSLAATQGVGYVNELIARLTNTPVVDHTTTNSTLDGNEETFPLNRTVYADFSHDNDMMGILTALRIFDHITPMENTTIPKNYGSTGDDGVEERDLFKVSWAVPFAGRVYFEKMVCDADGDGIIDEGEERVEYVRILVNDRVAKLNGCEADELGRCKLNKFVESMGFARRGGEWGKCFV